MDNTPSDRIYIRDLTCRCIVGINAEEREKKQEVCINIALHVDLRPAGRSDAIADTVDYKALKQRVLAMVENSEFFLVERLAEEVATICLADARVARVEVTIDKPGALRFARSVAVSIVRERSTIAFIAVGANIEPEANIARALDLVNEAARITAISTFYRADALERPEQPEFLNGACAILTCMEARQLKATLRSIEARLGRIRTSDRYAARPIDLDIALFGACVIDEEGLRIPDPDIRTRAFLAMPLAELAPNAILPDTGEAIADVAKRLNATALRPEMTFTQTLRARLGI